MVTLREKRGHLRVTETFECCFEKTLEGCWSATILGSLGQQLERNSGRVFGVKDPCSLST